MFFFIFPRIFKQKHFHLYFTRICLLKHMSTFMILCIRHFTLVVLCNSMVEKKERRKNKNRVLEHSQINIRISLSFNDPYEMLGYTELNNSIRAIQFKLANRTMNFIYFNFINFLTQTQKTHRVINKIQLPRYFFHSKRK